VRAGPLQRGNTRASRARAAGSYRRLQYTRFAPVSRAGATAAEAVAAAQQQARAARRQRRDSARSERCSQAREAAPGCPGRLLFRRVDVHRQRRVAVIERRLQGRVVGQAQVAPQPHDRCCHRAG
jgi:hypothetical protein